MNIQTMGILGNDDQISAVNVLRFFQNYKIITYSIIWSILSLYLFLNSSILIYVYRLCGVYKILMSPG